MLPHRVVLVVVALATFGCRDRSAGAPDLALPSCPPASTPLPAYDSDGSGTVVGSDVSATLCHVGVHLFVSPYTTPSGRALVMLDSVGHSPPQLPDGATGGVVGGILAVGAPAPGSWASSSDQACGGLDYSFQLPLPAGTDCDGGTAPACPANCSSLCSSTGCEPCAPNPPSVAYDAHDASDCLGGAQAAGGSWQVELTSVTPTTGPAAGDYYRVHGRLTASVQASGASTATLSLAF